MNSTILTIYRPLDVLLAYLDRRNSPAVPKGGAPTLCAVPADSRPFDFSTVPHDPKGTR